MWAASSCLCLLPYLNTTIWYVFSRYRLKKGCYFFKNCSLARAHSLGADLGMQLKITYTNNKLLNV